MNPRLHQWGLYDHRGDLVATVRSRTAAGAEHAFRRMPAWARKGLTPHTTTVKPLYR